MNKMRHLTKPILFGIVILVITVSFFGISFSGESADSPNKDDILKTWPFESRVLVNLTIQEMLDLVSPDIMIENLDTLVGFYTRHTNSDTLSDDVGIGAARRWIYDKFVQYSTDPEAVSLEPGYFTFDAIVCGTQGEHRNVMGTMSGSLTPFRYFIDMGHMDSRTVDVCDNTSFAPSANDDGSGTVVAMEMARVMSRFMFESTVVILVVTGEDQGLYGSTAYANWAYYYGADVGAAITNDVVGNIEGCDDPSCPPGDSVIIDSTSVRHFSGPPATGSSRQLTRYMKLKAMEYIDGFTINLIQAIDRPGRSGDHVPFYNRGFPAARFTEAHENGDGSGNNGRQHNEFDIISPVNTNAGYMANIAKINIAGMASLALAPATPVGLQAIDMGDGNRVFLTWPDEQSEPDFAGYRVAIRQPDELFYSDIYDVGDVNEYILNGLTDGETIYVSISAYDDDENESLFCDEVEFTARSIPEVPDQVEGTSTESGVELSWQANSELDIAGYNIYRQGSNQDEPELIHYLEHPQHEWTDLSLEPHDLYSYFISAVDTQDLESSLSEPVLGQLASHDYGILLIDGTINGGGNPFQPTDEQVDSFYDEVLTGYNVNGNWDIIDSSAAGVYLMDAHMAPYSVVMVHSDRPGAQLFSDTTAFRKYLDNGGRFLLSGWNLSLAIVGVNVDSVDFPPGSFFQEYLKVDSIRVSSSQNRDFIMAPSIIPSVYPDLIIDSLKVPYFDNRLFRMEAFFGALLDQPQTEAIYSYRSSLGEEFPLNGQPVGLRYIGDDYRVVLIDVPLYFIKQDVATEALAAALGDLGETQTDTDKENPVDIPKQFEISGNFPNPFNGSTIISYILPYDTDVRLTIYNLLGQEVEILVDEFRNAGEHSVTWNADDLPSGIYFARITVSGTGKSMRMILLK